MWPYTSTKGVSCYSCIVPTINPVFLISLKWSSFQDFPTQQEVHYESFTIRRFPSAVSPSQLQKKIPLRLVSLFFLASQPSLANVILLVSLKKKYWRFCCPWPKTINRRPKETATQYSHISTISASIMHYPLWSIPAVQRLLKRYLNDPKLFYGK